MKNIKPFNDKGLPHGYWERYFNNGLINYKCFYNNDKEIGYEEYYLLDNKLWYKTYHI